MLKLNLGVAVYTPLGHGQGSSYVKLPKEAFYSSLKDEFISDEDYCHAQNVFCTI